MKYKLSKISKLVFVLLIVVFLTGCRKVRQTVSSENVLIEYKTYNKYNIKYDNKYFRTAREEAIIIGDKFKIGIEHPIEIKNKKDFEKFKKKYSKEEDFKEVKYNGYKGFIFYTAPYIRYEIYLNIENKHILRLNIYSANDKKEFQTEALNSKDVQGVLKHMKVTIK